VPIRLTRYFFALRTAISLGALLFRLARYYFALTHCLFRLARCYVGIRRMRGVKECLCL